MADIILSLAVVAALSAAVAGALRLIAGPVGSRRAAVVRTTVCAALALPLAALLLYTLINSRSVQLGGDLVRRVDTADKLVALTFDDGPTSAHTRDVLRILERENVTATFFVTGAESSAAPAELKAIVEAGHELGNHTWSHPYLVFVPEGEIAGQFERTDRVIRAAGYSGPIPVRTPFGKKLLSAPLYLARTGRANVFWDSEADSTARIANDADRIVAATLADVRPGSIVLMHVMYDSRQPSRDALPRVIRGLRARGYRFVTVEQLLVLRRD